MSRRWRYFLISAILAALVGVAAYLWRARRRPGQDMRPLHASPRISSSLRGHLSGLTEAQARARQTPIDRDALKKSEMRRFWRELLRTNLLNFFNLDMAGVALAMWLLGSPWSAVLSLVVLVLSFSLNVFQQIYSKRKVDRLVEILRPEATVIREGRVRNISQETVVAGDFLVVTTGDRVSIDGVIVGDGQVWVDEVDADEGVVRRHKQAGDMLYGGSICINGEAIYRVDEVPPVEASLAETVKASVLPRTLTPLQKLLERIFRTLFFLVLFFIGLLFLDLSAAWFGVVIFDGAILRDIVSQIFAIAPTSLFFMIAVTYAIGLARMADVGALVYRAESIESLANTSVVCFCSSDTLTGQQATLELITAPGGYDQLSESRVRHILGDYLHSAFGNRPLFLDLAQSFPGEARTSQETMPFFSIYGWSAVSFALDDLRGTYILGEAELMEPNLVSAEATDKPVQTHTNKMKPTVRAGFSWLKQRFRHKRQDKNLSAPAAATVSADMSLKVAAESNGTSAPENGPETEAAPLKASWTQRWKKQFQDWFRRPNAVPQAASSSKVAGDDAENRLLFAYHPDVWPLRDEEGFPQLPSQLVALGWVHLSHGIRPEAAAVVQAFVKAGVKIKILSSEGPDRLHPVMEQLPQADDDPPAITTGADLDAMHAPGLARAVQHQDLFGRLAPYQQVAVVDELQAQENYVAVVGNQVSDIPAMRQADLSITAKSGSQASLTLADIVLMERSIRVLPEILYQGQRIVNSLLDTFRLYLSQVVAHLMLLIINLGLLAIPLPYSSTQASIVTTFTITFPAIFLPFWASIGRLTVQSIIRKLIHFVLPVALTNLLLAVSVFVWFWNAGTSFEYTRFAVTHALVAAGLVRVIFLKPPTQAWVGGSSLSGDRRPVWMALGIGVLYVAFILITARVPLFQEWFDLNVLTRAQDYLVVAVAVVLWTLLTRAIWRWLWHYGPWFGEP